MNQEGRLSRTITVTRVVAGPFGGAIIYGRDADNCRHKFIANSNKIFRPPEEGEIWTFVGMVESHAKYGQQIRVTSGYIDKPAGTLIVSYLARSPTFKGTGIGMKKAKRLWDTFGDELYSLFSKSDVDKLSRVLTPNTARKLVETWNDSAELSDMIPFLAKYGFDIRLTNKVCRVWPVNTINKLQENPYRMLAFANWRKVDAMAMALGIGKDDPRRFVAAVESVLYQRLDAKHTLTPRETILSEVSGILRTNKLQKAQEAIDRALSEYAVVVCTGGYQPLGAAVMEKAIANRLRSMLATSENPQPNLFSDCLSRLIIETGERFAVKHRIKLNAEQKVAVELATTRPFCVITGGAGVGKTTVLRVIHEVCEMTGIAVTQMALSGRAAQRMREATGRDATTIAKFLHHASNCGEVSARRGDELFIIDEASMLDLPLTYSIIRVLPQHARLLLVGDPYQLPPIGFGLIFQILASSENVPLVELVEVHRQAQSTGIPQIAHAIRNGVIPDLPNFPVGKSGVSFIDVASDQVMDSICEVMEHFESLSDVQILGVTKRGESGVRNINSMFHSIHSSSKKRLEGRELAEGDPVIYLTNDYKKELWNGSLGRIEVVEDKPSNESNHHTPYLVCDFDGVKHEITKDNFNDIDLAYAITVHKAQGSQFKKVIIPVVKSRLLDRTLIYTALTRGIEQVVFVGDRGAFNHAIKAQPRSQERMVGFSV